MGNCHLFGPGKESMTDYLSSCNRVGGALRNENGECLDGADAFCPSSPYCSGCVSCAADPCGLLVETECVIANSEVTTSPSIPSVEGCRSITASQGNANNINFFIYDQRAEICWGYDSGKRSCSNVVAAQTMDQATIDSCTDNEVIGIVGSTGHLFLEHLDHVVEVAGTSNFSQHGVEFRLVHELANIVEGSTKIGFVKDS